MRLLLFFLLCLPLLTYSQVVEIKHSMYVTEFDTTLNYPTKVYYWLTKDNAKNYKKDKVYSFCIDPLLQSVKLGNSYKLAKNYYGVKIANNDEVDNPSKSKIENSYYTNCIPLTPELINGDWRDADNTIRFLALKNDSVLVTCGAYGEKERIGDISIPCGVWKIAYVKSLNKYYCFHFFNNKNEPYGWKSHLVGRSELNYFINRF